LIDFSHEFHLFYQPQITPRNIEESITINQTRTAGTSALLSTVGNEPGDFQENESGRYYSDGESLSIESHRLATVGMGEKEMGRGGFEPPTHGFSDRNPCL